ncbi:hypothetical protein ACFE04_021136 [Oxalis oulophora]
MDSLTKNVVEEAEYHSAVKFTWNIEKFTSLGSNKLYSKSFTAGDHQWKVLLYPKGNNANYLSIYLSVDESAQTEQEFNATMKEWGFKSFIELFKLRDPTRGYLKNGTIVVEVEVIVRKPANLLSREAELDKNARNVINQDKIDNEAIYSDEMAMALLEKLDDEKSPNSVKISDFKDVASNSYVDVGIFTVPESLQTYAKCLLARNPSIGNGNFSWHYVNEMTFVVLCGALKSMDTTSFDKITESLILKWRDAIRGALQFGFKVDFLKDHLKSVTQAYLSKQLALNSEESKELQVTDDGIIAMEKLLEIMKANRAKYNKIKSEFKKSCEIEEAKFPAGKTCGLNFLN